MLGTGIAAADSAGDIVGKQYGEAKSLLAQEGLSPVVATVVGDRVAQDECYVVSTSKLTRRDSSGRPSEKQVQVNLNCYVGQSDTVTPGFSKGNFSPEAVAVRATYEKATKEWKASPQGQEWCAKFEARHPEWAPIQDCHPEME